MITKIQSLDSTEHNVTVIYTCQNKSLTHQNLKRLSRKQYEHIDIRIAISLGNMSGDMTVSFETDSQRVANLIQK